jgi:hypothetical protein
MSSLTDRPDDSSIGGRVLWLGQVSEAATALAGTRVPKQPSDIPGVSKISTGPIAADKSILLSVRRDDSVTPAVHVAKTHVRSDPPPLKWSDLRYVFDIKEDRNGKEAIQA